MDDSDGGINPKNFSSNVAIRFLTNALLQIRPLIFLPIFSKALGSENYGIWTQVFITINLLTPILMLRLETASVRYLSAKKDRKEFGEIFFSMLTLTLLITLAISIIIILLPNYFSYIVFGTSELSYIVSIFVILLMTHIFFMFLINYFRIKNNFNKLSIIQIIQRFSEIGFISILIIFYKVGLQQAIITVIIIQVNLSLFILFYIFKKLGLRFRINIGSKLKPYLKYSLPLIPSGASFWIINASDRYIIAHFLNLSQVGIYTASYGLAVLLMFFVTPISYVLFPTISKLWELKKIEQSKNYISESITYFLIFAIPSVFGLLHLGPYILRILATEEFVTSRLLLLMLLLSFILFGVYQMLYYIVDLKEKTKFMPIIYIPTALFNIILNFLLIPYLGLIGAAFSTLLSFLILTCIIFYLSRIWLPIKLNYIKITKSVISGILMYIIIISLIPKGFKELVFIILFGSIIYFVLLFMMKGFGKKEIKIIKNILRIK